MKKVLYVLVLFLGLAVITGCGCSKKVNYDKIISNMVKLENYKIVTNTNVNGDKSKEEISFDSKNKKYYSITTMDKDNKLETYGDITNNRLYVKNGNEWNTFEGVSSFIDFNNLKDLKYTIDGNDLNITMESDTLNKIYGSDSQGNVNNPSVIITTDGKNISKITISFENNENDKTNKVTIEMNYSEYDKIGEIVMPEVSNKDVLTPDNINITSDVYDYLYVITDDVMKTNFKDGTYTNTKLTYDGVEPTSVNLEIKDHQLKNGDITISGYKFYIENGQISKREKVE